MKKHKPTRLLRDSEQASTVMMQALVDKVGEARARQLIRQARVSLDKEIRQYAQRLKRLKRDKAKK